MLHGEEPHTLINNVNQQPKGRLRVEIAPATERKEGFNRVHWHTGAARVSDELGCFRSADDALPRPPLTPARKTAAKTK